MNNHNKIVIIFAVLLLYVQPGAGETEWTDHGKKTLYWGQTTDINDYTIEAVDFSPSRFTDFEDDWVLLDIYENGQYSDSATLAINNSRANDTAILCEDRLKIVAKEIITGFDIPSPYVVFQVYILKEEPVQTPVPPEQWIKETLEFSKCISAEMYTGDWIDVEVRVKKLKDFDLELTLNDSIPDGFELVPDPDKQLIWNLTLSEKDNTDVCQYSMKSTRPGTFTVPGARVVFNYRGITYVTSTDSSEIIIHGPDMNVTKTAEILDNKSITITVSVENTGDRATKIYVTDEIPKDAELVAGDLNFEAVAQPDKINSNEYIIRTNNKNKNLALPPVTVTFKDNRECQYEVKSEIVHVTVQKPSPTPSTTAVTATAVPANSTQTPDVPEQDKNSSIMGFVPDIVVKVTKILFATILCFYLLYLVVCKVFHKCKS